MDVGLFCLMGYRTRGTPTAAIYDDAVAQVKAAEQAGFAIAWFAEHHFSNYCVCPSPLTMVAHMAAHTSRIRLGSGVVIVPLYHPSRLIAEVGMVDSLAHGRLVLGIGSGYQPYEFERFGQDLQEAPARLLEVMAMMEKAFAAETFAHDGAHYAMPPAHIAPRPVRGMPDIYVAGDNPDLHRYAAERDCVVMVTPRHFTPAMLAAARARFEGTRARAGKPPETLRFGAMRPFCVTSDRQEAARFLENARWQIRLSQSLRRREQEMDGGMIVEKPWEGEPTLEEMAAHMLVGDAATVAARMAAEIRAASPCHYLLQAQLGDMPPGTALRSIAAWQAEVRPILEREFGPLDRIGTPAAAAA
ncbi:LLM class flavin-dependent oxidoreductase [Roseomonas sp. HF4]|uniref:LLM class flavin-dependent oxidoreductase n=1 Tax=Roseomonas sp. HF4 TaxID=2562313 RepID=UPI0010BF92D7|nr:LLM class flavin-dependent oxidoreductase [Roseomonas sp. HF4]